MTEQPGEGYYWAEDIAKLADIEVRTVHRYATSSQAMIDAGELPAYDTGGEMPPPVDRVKRQVGRPGAMRTVWSPRWKKELIDAWLPQRRGPGGRLLNPPAGEEG